MQRPVQTNTEEGGSSKPTTAPPYYNIVNNVDLRASHCPRATNRRASARALGLRVYPYLGNKCSYYRH